MSVKPKFRIETKNLSDLAKGDYFVFIDDEMAKKFPGTNTYDLTVKREMGTMYWIRRGTASGVMVMLANNYKVYHMLPIEEKKTRHLVPVAAINAQFDCKFQRSLDDPALYTLIAVGVNRENIRAQEASTLEIVEIPAKERIWLVDPQKVRMARALKLGNYFRHVDRTSELQYARMYKVIKIEFDTIMNQASYQCQSLETYNPTTVTLYEDALVEDIREELGRSNYYNSTYYGNTYVAPKPREPDSVDYPLLPNKEGLEVGKQLFFQDYYCGC